MASRLALDRKFVALTGIFYQAWTSANLAVDMAIGRLLHTNDHQTHVLTSGMEFGRKARLLHELIKKSDHKRRRDAITAINFLRNESKRNVFAHSYILTTTDTVTFVEREAGGPYRARGHTFTLEEYENHVRKVVQAAADLEKAFAFTKDELTSFAYAAMSEENNDNTSP